MTARDPELVDALAALTSAVVERRQAVLSVEHSGRLLAELHRQHAALTTLTRLGGDR